MTKVRLVAVSGNTKTGPIPVSTTERASCPTTCPFKGVCYEEYHYLKSSWSRVEHTGMDWSDFVSKVRALPKKQLWRHNEAGDLPGFAGTINRAAVRALVSANKGKRGFTYTHHKLTPANLKTITDAIAGGFTINISCETQEQVDHARSLGLPAVLVVKRNHTVGKNATTPGGAPLRICPAVTSDMTCARCGICQRADRQTVIVFPAHGVGARHVEAALDKAAQP